MALDSLTSASTSLGIRHEVGLRARDAISRRVARVVSGSLVLLGWTAVGGFLMPSTLPVTSAAPPDAATAEIKAARERLELHAKDPFEQRQRLTALRALARVGGPAAVDTVLGVLADPYAHVRDHAVSALADMLVSEAGPASLDRLVKKGLSSRVPEVRRGVALAFARAAGSSAAASAGLARAAVTTLDRESDATVVEALARALGAMRDPSVVSSLLRASTHRDGAAAGATLRALGHVLGSGDATPEEAIARAALEFRLGDRQARARTGAVDGLAAAAPAALLVRAASLAGDPAVEPRIALCDALPILLAIDRRATLALLDRLLSDASWRVRVAACHASVLLWDKDAVPLLIEQLRRERGRMVRDVLDVIETLTDASVGQDADLWASWWSVRGPSMVMGPRPLPDRYGRIRRKARRGPAEGEGSKTTAFFRLPIQSERLAFLFDFSGSMRDPARPDAPTTKAELARTEFGRVVGALSKDTKFDLFLHRYPGRFPPEPQLTRAIGSLAPASSATSRRAIDWLARQEPSGFGAFFDGLVDAAADDDVDTIVLLSDGVPSMGTYDRGPRVVEEWVRFNRFRRVAVDTILVGSKGTDRTFMADLASASWGRSEAP